MTLKSISQKGAIFMKKQIMEDVQRLWDGMPEEEKNRLVREGKAYANGMREGWHLGMIKGQIRGMLVAGASYFLYKHWSDIKDFVGRKLFGKKSTYTEPEETENDVFEDEIID
jgi:hypothetical protein